MEEKTSKEAGREVSSVMPGVVLTTPQLARSSPQLQLGPTLICSPQKVPTQSGFSHYGNLHLTTMSPNHGDTDEGEEDDYMSMVIEEPKFKETFTQRKRREQREVSTE